MLLPTDEGEIADGFPEFVHSLNRVCNGLMRRARCSHIFPNLIKGEPIDSAKLSESMNNCTSLEWERKAIFQDLFGEKSLLHISIRYISFEYEKNSRKQIRNFDPGCVIGGFESGADVGLHDPAPWWSSRSEISGARALVKIYPSLKRLTARGWFRRRRSGRGGVLTGMCFR